MRSIKKKKKKKPTSSHKNSIAQRECFYLIEGETNWKLREDMWVFLTLFCFDWKYFCKIISCTFIIVIKYYNKKYFICWILYIKNIIKINIYYFKNIIYYVLFY